MKIQTLNLEVPTGKQALAQVTAGVPGQIPSYFLGPMSLAGQFVGTEQALRCGIVLACIRVLSESLAGLPLQLLQRTPQGSVPALTHPLYRLLKSAPNPWQTHFELIEAMVIDILLNGSAFALKQYDGQGRIVGLVHLPADRLSLDGTVFDEAFGAPQLRYRYSGPDGQRVLLQGQLWRVDFMQSAIGQSRSLRLLAREAIGLSLAAQEQGARLFSQGFQTDLVLKTADTMNDDQREQVRKNLAASHAGSGKAFTPFLLEGGLDVSRIGLTAEESQYLESRKFQAEEIARIFRIPAVLLGIGDKSSTYASAEQFFLSFSKFTLAPWLGRFEEAIGRDLISPTEPDLYAKFSLDALLRADLKTRYDAYAIGVTNGFLTRNDVRELEDLQRLEGLDAPLTPLNMSTPNQAEALAGRLASIVTAHEAKLVADGRPLDKLPAFIVDKTGLTPAQAAAYLEAAPEEKPTLLKRMLLDPKV